MSTKCFAHNHMTPGEYGLWNLCRDLSFQSGVLLLDGRTMAARFANTSKSATYRTINALVSAGWLVLREPAKRGAGGKYAASRYQVLSHDEWVAIHGCAQCAPVSSTGLDEPVPSTGLDEPVPNSASPVPRVGLDLSQNSASPVPRAGHNLNRTNLNTSLSEEKQPEAHAAPLCAKGEMDSLILKYGTQATLTAENSAFPSVPLTPSKASVEQAVAYLARARAELVERGLISA
jgi:hypothetical protein